MKTKTRLIHFFPEHVVPDELSILSVYEVLIYLLCLWGCWYLYSSWNKIPVIEQDVQLERLISSRSDGTYVNVQYELPITSVFDQDNVATIKTNYYPMPKKYASKSYKDSDRAYVDSLKNVYFQQFPDSLTFKNELCYFKVVQKNMPRQKVTIQPFDTIIRKDWNNAVLYDCGNTQVKYHDDKQDNITYAYSNCILYKSEMVDAKYEHAISLKGDPTLTRPSFFSRRDISQAYYKINIETKTVDSIRFSIRFASAVSVSPMGELEPDSNMVNGLAYILVPNHNIKKKNDHFEILFHVVFKDLENSQSRRVFLITAILSGLITIFLAFLVIFVYLVVRLSFDRMMLIRQKGGSNHIRK